MNKNENNYEYMEIYKINTHLGSNPRILLAVIGGAIKSSSIISSVSSSPVKEDDDFVGD